jgi:hypothetical protein
MTTEQNISDFGRDLSEASLIPAVDPTDEKGNEKIVLAQLIVAKRALRYAWSAAHGNAPHSLLGAHSGTLSDLLWRVDQADKQYNADFASKGGSR